MPGTVVDTEKKTMEKTDPCLVQASDLASVRGGMKSLVIHSCGFIFCMSIRLEVWLIPREVQVRARAAGSSGWLEWAGRQASWGAFEPLGRFPCNHDAPCAAADLDSPIMGTTEKIRCPGPATFDLCALGHLT